MSNSKGGNGADVVSLATTTSHNPLVYIIVLNWNGWNDTLACLNSLDRLTYDNYRVLVVDNNSTDDSVKSLRQARPKIVLLQTTRNRGYAGGNNLGIRYAMQQGAKYVWLLNNDTTVDIDALITLVAHAETMPLAGFVGSKILFASQPDRIWFAGGTVSKTNGVTNHIGFNTLDSNHIALAGPIDYATGCSLLVRCRAISTIGELPEIYFHFGEELDWQFTAKQHGWSVTYEPKSLIYHKVSTSIGDGTPRQIYYLERSRSIFVLRHLPQALIGSIFFCFRHLILHHLAHRRWALATASIKGMLAGLIIGARSRRSLVNRMDCA